MVKWLKTAVAIGLVGSMCVPAIAATKAPVKKPVKKAPAKAPAKPAPRPVVKSATQLKGDDPKFGEEWTIGKQDPVNFILNSAEYTLGRQYCGDAVITPKADEKLLVLKFTVRNPRSEEASISWGTLNFTVVDDSNSNHDCGDYVSTGANGETFNVTVKPAQKYDAYAIIRVPAKTSIPKLIVKSQDDLVLRYDLREKIKPLVAPFADPEKSKGHVALEEIPGTMGTSYVLNEWDVTIDSAAYTNDPPKDVEPEEDTRFLVVYATVKNGTKTEQPLSWGTFAVTVTTEDGDNIDCEGKVQYGKRNEYVNGELKPGQDMKVRFYFTMPKDVQAKTFTIKIEESHTYTFDVSKAQ